MRTPCILTFTTSIWCKICWSKSIILSNKIAKFIEIKSLISIKICLKKKKKNTILKKKQEKNQINTGVSKQIISHANKNILLWVLFNKQRIYKVCLLVILNSITKINQANHISRGLFSSTFTLSYTTIFWEQLPFHVFARFSFTLLPHISSIQTKKNSQLLANISFSPVMVVIITNY